MIRGADISKCGRYRTLLWRQWDTDLPCMNWVMLNPSTADAETDDATIRVCIGRARLMGFGGIRVANLFNYRATDPRELARIDDPIGPGGNQALWNICSGADPFIIAAWGNGGLLKGDQRARWREVTEDICEDTGNRLHALKLTNKGQPRHPLRIAYAEKPFLWMDREKWLQSI